MDGDISTASPGHSESPRKGQGSKEKERKEIAVEITRKILQGSLEKRGKFIGRGSSRWAWSSFQFGDNYPSFA